nr:zinc finger BED domain-containing protein RICESLEEPER 2-like [Ipomoea batatas]
MARDILAIPVSSVASESAFSTSGRILDKYWSSLTPYMVEALILTQDWLRSSLQSDATVSLVQILEETEFMDLLAEGELCRAIYGAALSYTSVIFCDVWRYFAVRWEQENMTGW